MQFNLCFRGGGLEKSIVKLGLVETLLTEIIMGLLVLPEGETSIRFNTAFRQVPWGGEVLKACVVILLRQSSPFTRVKTAKIRKYSIVVG